MKWCVFLILILSGHYSNGQTFFSRNFEIKKLSPYVYAAIAKNGGYSICNAGIIDLGSEVLVFDPFMTPQAAKDLKEFISTQIRKPVKYVVNSHYHNDHIRGNQVFASATIIATNLTRKLIQENEPEEQADEAKYAPKRLKYYDSIGISTDNWQATEDSIWRGYYEGMIRSHAELKTVLPDLTFNDSLSIYGKNIQVKLISYGSGHTPSDVILYLPKEKIAFMGDILFINNHPWIADGQPEAWINYLQKVQLLNINTFVPGHGPIGNTNNLSQMVNYLQSIIKIGKLLPPEATDEMILSNLPKEYSDWHLKQFFTYNIRFLIKKLHGTQ